MWWKKTEQSAKNDDRLGCVPLTMHLGGDLSIHNVATEVTHHPGGWAGRYRRDAMATASARGMQNATPSDDLRSAL
jgi:hypothetical protein